MVAAMGTIDWFFEHEAEYFATRLRKLVLEIHRLASEQLEQLYNKEVEEAERDEVLNEVDRADYQRYLGGEQESQQRALSTMALTMLASLIESFLSEARSRFDANAFPSANTYAGKSVLLRRITEYRERFEIDLTSLPGFDAVREVVLARNSCVHDDGHPSLDYLAQTQRRFLKGVEVSRLFGWISKRKDEVDLICCDVETLTEVVAEVSEFAMTLHAEMNAVRSRYHSKNQVSDTPPRWPKSSGPD